MSLKNLYTAVDPSQELPTFADILHEHAQAKPNSNLFLVPDTQRKHWNPVKYGQFDRYVSGLQLYYKSLFEKDLHHAYSSGDKAPVVILLVSRQSLSLSLLKMTGMFKFDLNSR